MLPPQATPSSLPRKKLQKHNQLGLTPSTNENESSSDEDEEAKLANSTASTTGSNSALYSFEYKGRLSTLQTAADIAAWIAERKKRFPTAAKAEAARKEAEKKRREWEKSKKEKAEAQRLQRLEREKAKQEELRKRALESVRAKKVKDEEKHQTAPEGNTGEEVVTKTAIKTEKLRRKLEKAQRDARKAQEALARIRQESIDTKKPASDKDVPSGLHPKLPRTNTLVTSHAETEDDIKKLKEKLLKDDDDHLLNASDVSSEISLSVDDSDTDSIDDYTSSCGSSSVCDSEADPRSSSDQDSDSGPEELTSKRTAPDRVPPPPRTTTSTSTSKPDASTSNPDHRSQIPCRNMFRSGRCHYGDQCRYSHELPEKMARGRERRKQNDGVGEKQKGRKSLYQVMVEKEVEAERREVVEVILRMGERGMLEELKTTEEGREK